MKTARERRAELDERQAQLTKLFNEIEAFTKRCSYKPARTYTVGNGPPNELGPGLIAINVPDRRLWIGTAGGTVEVKSVDELIDRWVEVIDHDV